MKNLKDINWNHLFYFNEVAKSQSLKKASAILGIANSTLSEQLKKLEYSFGRKLFDRSPKGIELTTDGYLLYSHTKVIFEEGSKVLERYSESSLGGYSVAVGVENSLLNQFASEFISRYWDIYAPFGTVNTFKQNDFLSLEENVLKGNVDWAISTRVPKRKQIKILEIGSYELSFLVSKKLYSKFINEKDILMNIPLAISSSEPEFNKMIKSYLHRQSATPKEFIQSDHFEFLVKLCERGRCVMMMLDGPMDKTLKGLTQFKLEERFSISLYAVWKKVNDNLVAIKKLKELVQSNMNTTPERYNDIDLQIEVSDVSEKLLRRELVKKH